MKKVAGLFDPGDPPLSPARSAGRIRAIFVEICPFSSIFKKKRVRLDFTYFVKNCPFQNKECASSSHSFITNCWLSKEECASSSRMFVENRRFSNRTWAVQSRIFEAETCFKIYQWPFSALVSENDTFWNRFFAKKVVRVAKVFRVHTYPRTDGRTDETVFLLTQIQNPRALRGAKHSPYFVSFGIEGLT